MQSIEWRYNSFSDDPSVFEKLHVFSVALTDLLMNGAHQCVMLSREHRGLPCAVHVLIESWERHEAEKHKMGFKILDIRVSLAGGYLEFLERNDQYCVRGFIRDTGTVTGVIPFDFQKIEHMHGALDLFYATRGWCRMCHRSPETSKRSALLFCAKCGKVQYCSKDCQREDWKRHSQDCGRSQNPFDTDTKS